MWKDYLLYLVNTTRYILQLYRTTSCPNQLTNYQYLKTDFNITLGPPGPCLPTENYYHAYYYHAYYYHQRAERVVLACMLHACSIGSTTFPNVEPLGGTMPSTMPARIWDR